jgi:putative ABC transport system permease protein
MTLAHLVVKNTWRNPRRSLLTILYLAFSFLLLTLLMMIWRSFYVDSWSESGALRLVCRNRVSLFVPLPGQYRAKIRTIPGVAHIAPMNHFAGRYQNGGQLHRFLQVGTDPSEFMSVYLDYHLSPEQLSAWQADPNGAVVESTLARNMKWKLGDRIVLQGVTFPFDLQLTIRGIFTAAYPVPALYFNWNYVRQITHKDIDEAYMILANSQQSVTEIAIAVDEMFRNSTAPTRTEAEQAFTLDFLSMFGNMKLVILSIGSALLFAALLGAANTMGMSLRERTREVSVLRSIGFTPRRLQLLFLAEALTICLVAWLLASLTMCGSLWAVSRSHAEGIFAVFFKLRLETLMTSLFVALDVGLASSLYSAYSMARTNIAQGLRHSR